MKLAKLEEMKGGWFVGDFLPTVYSTENCEVAVKIYQAGDYESAHYHKIATEITVITSGEVEMNGIRYQAGDIVIEEPGDITDFRAITNVTNVVVKIPSVKDDKYIVGDLYK